MNYTKHHEYLRFAHILGFVCLCVLRRVDLVCISQDVAWIKPNSNCMPAAAESNQSITFEVSLQSCKSIKKLSEISYRIIGYSISALHNLNQGHKTYGGKLISSDKQFQILIRDLWSSASGYLHKPEQATHTCSVVFPDLIFISYVYYFPIV